MRKRYRMFRRSGVFYVQDNLSGKQASLHTRKRADAERLFHAKNEAAQGPLLNRDLDRVYLSASDPDSTKRTWSAVMEELRSHGRASTQLRYARTMRDAALDGVRNKPIIETNAADLLAALRRGTSCTNHFLRRLHNLAIGLGWLNWPLLAPNMWPKVKWRRKRGITQTEHELITSTECSAERRLYYELLRETGGSQSDVANLTSANIDWEHRILWFHRAKLKAEAEPARITIGPRLEALLRRLPNEGALFPYWSQTSPGDRAAEFRRRCRILKIEGVSLHSYRYAWAERAFEHGYSQDPWWQEAGPTVFAPFPNGTEYFGRKSQNWMINFRVKDLDAIVAQLRTSGIEVTVDPESYPNGPFARLHDPEGNPVELWEPKNHS